MEPSDDEDSYNHQNPFYWSREHAQIEFSYQEGYRSLGHRWKIFDKAPYTNRTNALGKKNAGRKIIHTGVIFFPCRQIEVGQRCDLGSDCPPGTS